MRPEPGDRGLHHPGRGDRERRHRHGLGRGADGLPPAPQREPAQLRPLRPHAPGRGRASERRRPERAEDLPLRRDDRRGREGRGTRQRPDGLPDRGGGDPADPAGAVVPPAGKGMAGPDPRERPAGRPGSGGGGRGRPGAGGPHGHREPGEPGRAGPPGGDRRGRGRRQLPAEAGPAGRGAVHRQRPGGGARPGLPGPGGGRMHF